MKMSRRAALAAMAGALVATGAAAQTKPAGVELKKIFPYLREYYGIPAAERSRFTMAYYLTPASGVTVKVGDQDLPIGADGRFMRLPTLQQLQAGQRATLGGAKGTKFNISMELEPTLRPAARLSAPELAASIDEANRGIKKAAPAALRMVVPKMASVKFLGAGSGEVLMAGGRRGPLPVVQGQPLFEPGRWAGAETVVLARTPSRMEIGPAPKPTKKK